MIRTWRFAMLNHHFIAMDLRNACFQMALTCCLITSLPTWRVPCKLCSWVEVNGQEWGSQPQSEVLGTTSELLTKSVFWLSATSGQALSFHEVSCWQTDAFTLIGTSCQEIAAFQFLCGCMCATHSIWQVYESHLWLPIFPIYFRCPFSHCKAITVEKSVCNMRSSIFSSFYFRQILPRKK